MGLIWAQLGAVLTSPLPAASSCSLSWPILQMTKVAAAGMNMSSMSTMKALRLL